MLKFFKKIKLTFFSLLSFLKILFFDSLNLIWDFLKEFYEIIINIKKIILWIILLPITIFSCLINALIILYEYLFILFIFLFKYYNKYIKHNEVNNLRVRSKVYNLENYMLIFITTFFLELNKKRAFLILYLQIDFFKNVKNLTKKNSDSKMKIIYNLLNFLVILIFRKILFFFTNLPFIVLKNNNFLVNKVFDIYEFNFETYNDYFSTLILNILTYYSTDLFFKVDKLSIIFENNTIVLNLLSKDLEFLKKFTEMGLWVDGSKNLIKGGIITQLRYAGNLKTLPNHYSIFFKNKKNEEILVINQTTQKFLEIYKNKQQYYEYKSKLGLDLKVKALFAQKDAYQVFPHVVDRKNIILGDSSKLIQFFNDPIHAIYKFTFVQSFIINLEFNLYKFDPKNNLLRDHSYLKVRDYIIKNFNGFNDATKKGFEQLLDFYQKNQTLFENEYFPFISLLYKAHVNEQVKNYFLEILNKT